MVLEIYPDKMDNKELPPQTLSEQGSILSVKKNCNFMRTAITSIF